MIFFLKSKLSKLNVCVKDLLIILQFSGTDIIKLDISKGNLQWQVLIHFK